MSDLIVSTPGILGGAPRIAGTRIAAATIAALIERGVTYGRIYELYPEVRYVHVRAVRDWMRDKPTEPEPVDNGHRTLALYALMYMSHSVEAVDDDCRLHFCAHALRRMTDLALAVAHDQCVTFTGEHITQRMYGGDHD